MVNTTYPRSTASTHVSSSFRQDNHWLECHLGVVPCPIPVPRYAVTSVHALRKGGEYYSWSVHIHSTCSIYLYIHAHIYIPYIPVYRCACVCMCDIIIISYMHMCIVYIILYSVWCDCPAEGWCCRSGCSCCITTQSWSWSACITYSRWLHATFNF